MLIAIFWLRFLRSIRFYCNYIYIFVCCSFLTSSLEFQGPLQGGHLTSEPQPCFLLWQPVSNGCKWPISHGPLSPSLNITFHLTICYPRTCSVNLGFPQSHSGASLWPWWPDMVWLDPVWWLSTALGCDLSPTLSSWTSPPALTVSLLPSSRLPLEHPSPQSSTGTWWHFPQPPWAIFLVTSHNFKLNFSFLELGLPSTTMINASLYLKSIIFCNMPLCAFVR